MDEFGSPATLILVAVTVAASLYAWRHERFYEKHLLDTARVRHAGEWRRMLGSGFLHADPVHLAFNMLALYSFGGAVEAAQGPLALLAVHLLGILGGSALSLFVHRNEEYRAVGASGGVCAVLFAAILLFPGMSVRVFLIPVAIPSLVFAPLYLILSTIGLKKRLGNVGHDAHIGGSVTGLLVVAALHPEALRRGAGVYLAVLALVTLAFVLAYGAGLGYRLRRLRRRGAAAAGRAAGRESAPEAAAGAKADRDQRELDRLLDKVWEKGAVGLAETEKRRLEELARRRKRRN
jgi:membrane associated rhomboid family serine protease